MGGVACEACLPSLATAGLLPTQEAPLMDGNRFDAIVRTVSSSSGVTRRRSLLGSLAAAAGIAGGTSRRAAAAGSCAATITATIRSGPSASLTLPGANPGELAGTITFSIAPTGAIDQGALTLRDGTALPIVGQATGRQLALRARVGLGQTLVLMGVADQDVTGCSGAVDGLLTGPQPGDLGDWHATLAGAAVGATTAAGAPTMISVGPTTPSATAGAPAPTVGSAPTAAATAAPTSAATAAPTTAPTVAPTTTPTMEPTAISCPAGTTLCGDACVDLQTDVDNCGACGRVCPAAQPGFVSDCAAGNCFFRRAPAPPCDSGLTRCAGGCVNL